MIRAAALAAALALAAPAAAQPYPNAPGPVPLVPPGVDVAPEPYIAGCLAAAAAAHDVPAGLLVAILRVEGGTLGRVSPNASGAPPDIGPMQVNAIWLPRLAERWRVGRERAYIILRDNFCANVEAGAWILGLAIRDGGRDLMRGIGYYHSRTPHFHARYMRKVRAALRELVRAGPATPAMEAAACTTDPQDPTASRGSSSSDAPSPSWAAAPPSPGSACARRSSRPS